MRCALHEDKDVVSITMSQYEAQTLCALVYTATAIMRRDVGEISSAQRILSTIPNHTELVVLVEECVNELSRLGAEVTADALKKKKKEKRE